MEKSRDAFRTISEVADWLGTPTHVLRFWESRFSQIKPVKRAGGRRYYRPADMELLGGIKRLLHDDGLTIRGVQKILREEGVKHVAALSPPVDLPDDVDIHVVEPPREETDNVVKLTPTPADAPAPAAKATEPEETAQPSPADGTEEAAPDAAEQTDELLPATALDEAGVDETGSDTAAPATDADQPPPAEPEKPSQVEAPLADVEEAPKPAPEPQSAPRPGIFTAPPLAPDRPAAPAADAAPDAAPVAPEAKPEKSGPDREALRPIYDRLLALRDRMASDTGPKG